MNTPAADDYPAIKARMEEIERERAMERVEEIPVSKTSDMPYLGWDIYPPVNVSNG